MDGPPPTQVARARAPWGAGCIVGVRTRSVLCGLARLWGAAEWPAFSRRSAQQEHIIAT
jgi:hypothetical protein